MSKITDQFNAQNPIMYSHSDVIILLNHARALEAMLRKHEWARYNAEWSIASCPECGGDREDIGWAFQRVGHAPDCQLARLLD